MSTFPHIMDVAGQNRRPPARGSALHGLSIKRALPSSPLRSRPRRLHPLCTFSVFYATLTQRPSVPPENTSSGGPPRRSASQELLNMTSSINGFGGGGNWAFTRLMYSETTR